jgi:simple sugar transport system permease protein
MNNVHDNSDKGNVAKSHNSSELWRYFARRYSIQLSVFGVLVVLFSIFILVRPNVFLSYNIYFAFMSSIPFTAIVALALTLVVIAGEIDLSFPSIMGLGGWIFTAVYVATNNIYLGFLVCLIAGTLMGTFNGVLVTKVRIPSLIATIGTMYLWRGITMVLCGGRGTPLVAAKSTFLFTALIGRLPWKKIPMQAVWTVVIAVILWFVLNRHKFGARVNHVGDNVTSARMMGINTDRVKIITFMQMGFFATFAGVLASLEVMYLWPTLGEGYLIKVVAAVFVGGTSIAGGEGTLFGTFMGVIIIGCLEAGIIAMGMTGFWTQAVYGAVIVISLSFYSFMRREG